MSHDCYGPYSRKKRQAKKKYRERLLVHVDSCSAFIEIAIEFYFQSTFALSSVFIYIYISLVIVSLNVHIILRYPLY